MSASIVSRRAFMVHCAIAFQSAKALAVNLNSFFSNAQQCQADYASTLPPVHLWNPSHCGDIDIRIDATGQWHHQGSVIRRPALVALFSSLLKRENDEYFLVTPQEKCKITVDIAPLLITQCDVKHAGQANQTLLCQTAQGQSITVDRAHPLSLTRFQGMDYPIVHVRDGLNALVSRNVFYQLSECFENYDAEAMKNHALISSGAVEPHLNNKRDNDHHKDQHKNHQGAIVIRSAACVFLLDEG